MGILHGLQTKFYTRNLKICPYDSLNVGLGLWVMFTIHDKFLEIVLLYI